MKSGVLVAKVYSFLHVTTNYLAFSAYAFGPSMIPTLHPSGNVVLSERISKVSRGDVVVLQSPQDPNKLPIKRVIGLEGDCVSFVVDKDESRRTILVPKGHVWVEGDYTHNSRDSRIFGPLPYGLILGRVLWRVWPFKILDPLDRPQLKGIWELAWLVLLADDQGGLLV
ncbi:hypothetical protein N665_0029s0081 [Sinapis alba]|nr:hypothetical protein N665_0029s0081 [Sinapis alba]